MNAERDNKEGQRSCPSLFHYSSGLPEVRIKLLF